MAMPNSLRQLQGQPDSNIKRGNKFMIPPTDLRIQEGYNVRAAFNPEYWETEEAKERINSFTHSYTEGKFVPPIVVQVRDGLCYIRDGEHRYRGLVQAVQAGAQIQHVDVVEVSGDELDELDTLHDSNNGKPWGIMEKAIIVSRYSAYGLTNKDIAKRMHLSEATISNYLLVMQMPLNMKKRLSDGSLQLSVALEQYRAHGTKGLEKPVKSKSINAVKKKLIDIFAEPKVTEQSDGYHLVLSADQYAAIMEYTDLLKPEPEGE